MERLQKFIANSGYTSRRKAEELISNGKVKVNGKIITTLGYKVKETDEVMINNDLLKKETYVYYLLNKPRGVISSCKDEKNRKTVIDLINDPNRIFPVGRLDYDTTGALILTNDGSLANILTHPSNLIEKVYIAKIKGKIDPYLLNKLKKGIKIDNYKTSPCKAKIKSYNKKTDTSLVEVIIHEGKNHEVKKMFKQIGYEVIKLKREKIAFLTLDNLKSGEYRKLTIKEVKKLYSLGNKKDKIN